MLTFASGFGSKYLMTFPLEITSSGEKFLLVVTVSDDRQYCLNFQYTTFPVAIFIHWSNSLAGKQESLIIKHSTSLKKKVNCMFMLQHPQNVETSVSVISWKLRPVHIVVGENSVSQNYLTVWYAEAFLCTCLSFLDCFAKILWFF